MSEVIADAGPLIGLARRTGFLTESLELGSPNGWQQPATGSLLLSEPRSLRLA